MCLTSPAGKDPLRVLLVQYSLSNETAKATDEFLRGVKDTYIEHGETVTITKQSIEVQPAFNFPWKLWDFLGVMPETIVDTKWRHEWSVKPPTCSSNNHSFDFVVLGWQTWYLCPSLPVQLALENKEYQTLFQKTQKVVLIGTHRNMWHQAASSLCQAVEPIIEGKQNIVGQINFCQSSPFLVTVVQTLRRQLQGVTDVGLTTAAEQARKEGQQFAKHHFQQQQTNAAAAKEVYHGGAPFNAALSYCEEVWYPLKKLAATIMGRFAPSSLGRKVVALMYIPILISGVVLVAPSILLLAGARSGFNRLYITATAPFANNQKDE